MKIKEQSSQQNCRGVFFFCCSGQVLGWQCILFWLGLKLIWFRELGLVLFIEWTYRTSLGTK